jgi:hypothetical protein
MLSILDFSWRDFRPDVVEGVRVGELYDLARAHASELFVVHDRALRWTALVIPDVVTVTVERFDLSKDTPAVAVGMVDLLRRDQMSLSLECQASLAARLALWREATVVHAVEDDGTPRGLFIPDIVAERLPGASMLTGGSPELRESAQGPMGRLGEALAAIEAELPAFHSESLNSWGPSPYVCHDHGLQHKVSFCPCDKHPEAVCARRAVATRPVAATA